MLNAGETANVEIQFSNTGDLTWHPDDDVELRLEPWSLLSPVIEALPLAGPIAPGETASWTWKMNTSGVLVNRFQMHQKKEPFGPEAAVILVVLPKGWEDKRQEIEQGIQDLIDEWEQKKDAAIDDLIQKIVVYAEKKLNDYFKKVFGGCTFPALIIGGAALGVLWRRRRRWWKPEE